MRTVLLSLLQLLPSLGFTRPHLIPSSLLAYSPHYSEGKITHSLSFFNSERC